MSAYAVANCVPTRRGENTTLAVYAGDLALQTPGLRDAVGAIGVEQAGRLAFSHRLAGEDKLVGLVAAADVDGVEAFLTQNARS